MSTKMSGGIRWALPAAAALSLLPLACHKSDSAVADRAPVPRVKVQTSPIVERMVPILIPLAGTLMADLRTELTANSSGRVTKTFVERGQKVKQGAILAQLDVRSAAANAAEAQASVASAKTQLDSARAECDRYDALVGRGAITQQEHDRQIANCSQQLAAVAVTKARVTSASLVVGDGTIRAPFAGVITERWVSVGDYVQAPSKVVTLVVSNPLRLKLTVPERRASEVKEGALVTFAATGLPGRTFSGNIKYVSGEVRMTTRDVVVEAIVANDDGALLPGMFVDVSLHTGERLRPVSPKSAIFATGQEKSMYVVKDHRLELRIVNVGVELEDGGVALEEGAKAGEVAVVDPTPSLSDGAEVE
jgi:membrane fusion protein (multidrug efflux system)